MSTRKYTNFEIVYNEFLRAYKNQVKEQTFRSFTYNFESHILPYFKDFDIKKLTKKDFLNWKNFIYQKNFKNSFNKKIYTEFNSFLKYCIDTDLIKHNYLKDLGNFRNKIELNNSDFYTLKEFKRFIRGFDKEDEIYKQFFTLLFFTGLRPGEAMALKFTDLKGNYLTINKNIQSKGHRKLETPKNQSSIRTIQIDKRTLKGILKLKKLYSNFKEDFFIFGGSKPLSQSTVDRRKKKACLKSNIKVITQHQFRHSHATLLLNNGISITEISRRLGHSRTSTTLDIYSHTNLEQEKRVLSKLNLLH